MKVEKSTWGTALAAILVMAASALFLVEDYQSETANHRAVMLARGQTALDALTAGIRAQGRMGRYRHDRLSYIFEELAAAPDIIGVTLGTAGGTAISSGGITAPLSDIGSDEVQWSFGALILRREVSLDIGGHGYGWGRGGMGPMESTDGDPWEPFPAGPHVLAIALDTAAMEFEIRRDQLRLAVSLSGAALLVALASAAALGGVRRRRLQTALLVAREQAAHQERLTRLGAGLAHETKNPLGIVRGQAQLIAETPGDEAANRERAEHIVDEIDRTVGHINSFLALARPSDIRPAPLALGPFLEIFAALMEGEAKQHQVLLAVTAPEVLVHADEGPLRKALLNLVLNALRACSPGGRINIEVDTSGPSVTLAVCDTGQGIAPEDLARVTEPYFTRFEGGCGLGLTLVDQIARAHGWALHIDSALGEGTRVSLTGIERVSPTHE